MSLKGKGLDCTGIRLGKEFNSWECRTPKATAAISEMIAEVWGPDASSVGWINAQAFQYVRPSDDVASAFLGYVATVPYTGAQPAQARRWVEDNIGRVDTGKPAVMTIGAARFELVGPPTARFLQIKVA